MSSLRMPVTLSLGRRLRSRVNEACDILSRQADSYFWREDRDTIARTCDVLSAALSVAETYQCGPRNGAELNSAMREVAQRLRRRVQFLDREGRDRMRNDILRACQSLAHSFVPLQVVADKVNQVRAQKYT